MLAVELVDRITQALVVLAQRAILLLEVLNEIEQLANGLASGLVGDGAQIKGVQHGWSSASGNGPGAIIHTLLSSLVVGQPYVLTPLF